MSIIKIYNIKKKEIENKRRTTISRRSRTKITKITITIDNCDIK